jgi:steroid 5-alpha reductase family enzyme
MFGLLQTPAVSVALSGLAWIALLALATWLASLARHDASLVDRTWSLLIAGAAVVYAWQLAPAGARMPCLLGLVVAWAVRLSVFVTRRNWGHGEDRRYQAIRARNQPGFAWKSLYLVFGLQALLAWAVSTPFLAAFAADAAAVRPLGAVDIAGIALAAFGLAFEAVGDAQLARFKNDPAHRGQVMDRGLWRYTRHPNYFGEACIWWGFWLLALGASGLGAAWTVVSPILMAVLLLKVSGVALLEHDIAERRPAYRDYIARTNAFLPGPPRPAVKSR